MWNIHHKGIAVYTNVYETNFSYIRLNILKTSLALCCINDAPHIHCNLAFYFLNKFPRALTSAVINPQKLKLAPVCLKLKCSIWISSTRNGNSIFLFLPRKKINWGQQKNEILWTIQEVVHVFCFFFLLSFKSLRTLTNVSKITDGLLEIKGKDNVCFATWV